MSDIVDEMVLAVAHAICKSRTCEGVDCCQWPANRGRTKCPVNAGGYDDAARDAIEAMRVNEWAAQAATEIKCLRAQVEQAKDDSDRLKVASGSLERYRDALFMCAASCQGGHSDAGQAAADLLGVPFPVHMPDMIRKAISEGRDPKQLWPWYPVKTMAAIPSDDRT